VTVLLCAIALSLEYVLQALGAGSLCGTQACKTVGGYVRFGEGMLVLLGSLFFWILFGLLFFACRYERPWLWGAALLGLLGALAFDGALLGYQFAGLGLMCWICVAVAAGLALVLTAAAWRRGSLLLLAAGIAVWCGGFAANSALQLTPDMPRLEETAFLEHSPAGNEEGPRYYLFFSLDCRHCTEVLYNLSRVAPASGSWHLAAVNRDAASRAKLARAARTSGEANAFARVLRAKKAKVPDPAVVPEHVRRATRKAGAYFRAMGFRGVPVLLVRKNSGIRISLTGVDNISRYLWEQGVVSEWASPAVGS
jgi:hypothetical protein